MFGLREAELFFRVRRRYKIQDRENRVLLLRKLAKRGNAEYIRDVCVVVERKVILRPTWREIK